ncbi:MAG: hypothetical protein JWR61_4197 [Ferruginibacter sp.]|uniref:hypothetical protein n=1 Tax=Ferruginibacter sp. TaxID=1940288 RepID=UPI0026597311|nr:hypothetical protein [Ferruginibacter sp.]MDB5279242.1 hypothetical protein [Ferruginibacter sp.]
MTRTLIFFLSVCLLICSCSNSKKTKDDDTNDKAGITILNYALKKFEEPSQTFKVSGDKPSVVTGRRGTKISINPNDLITESGKLLGQNIEVELKELTNTGQLLKSNAQTTSDGKLLISGGAYFIGVTSNGEQLKLKEGKNLSVQLPKLSDKEMALFYGQRNDLGQMNWQKATETFKASKQPANTTKTNDTTSISYIVWDDEKKSDIDKIMDYVDSGYNPTPEEKERNIKQRKNYVVSQKVYDEIGISKLGWINCDRFLEADNTTELYATFNPQDSVKNANVYLVFKDINSVIQASYYSDKSPQFENMPIGYKARLIAYTVKDEKVFAYSTDLTITKGQKITLHLKEINDKDFKKLISN